MPEREPGDAQMRQNMEMPQFNHRLLYFWKDFPHNEGDATPFDRTQALLFQYCEKQTEQEDK